MTKALFLVYSTILCFLSGPYLLVDTKDQHCGHSNNSELLTSNVSSKSKVSCPLGFDCNAHSCQCIAHEFNGIWKCARLSMRANVIHGYWVGLCKDGSLCTGNCPFGFCSYNGSSYYDLQLPSTFSELDNYICGEHRSGVLCGECRGNYSVSYHSYSYTCTSNDLCSFGWIFYIISELVPVTVVFLLVMIFNVSFTSGAVNGFILFAQLQDSLTVHGNGVIHIPSEHEFFIAFYRLVYRFFNFEFFSIEKLSFCLWKHATVMDAMAFKYITILYGLALVFMCVFVMNTSRVRRLFSCLRPRTLRSTMIHGLTAFFVMCYSQCARVSIQILGPMYLYKKGPEYAETVVFRSGQYEMFQTAHLKYAIPAIFFFSTLLLLPPLILLLYPLSYKVLAICNLSESRLVNTVSRYIPMQLLDSFQSSFKDDVRFFAGLYFLYRIITLALFSASRSLTQFYILLELFLIIALALHAIVQPYKNRWHNVIDTLLFADLSIINGMTLYNYQKAIQGVDSDTNFNYLIATVVIQLILIYLPLICITIACLLKIAKKAITYYKAKHPSTVSSDIALEDSCNLPPLRYDTDEMPRTANETIAFNDSVYKQWT